MVEAALWVRRSDDPDTKAFQGILIVTTFPKRFEGRTLILTDEGLILNIIKDALSKLQRVLLEDPRFEKLFQVLSDNQVEAHYLLTPTFQERVKALSGQVGRGRMQLALDQDALLISIENYSNWFEAGLML